MAMYDVSQFRLLSLGILWNEKNDDVSPMCNSKIQNKTKV